MITFNYETSFSLSNEPQLSKWIEDCIIIHDFKLGEINYIFCDDSYLHSLNVKFLNHDTLTDIISFDNTVGRIVSGDIFISVDRVKENANDFKVSFDNELYRVIIHGVLHYLGFKDKTVEEKSLMRAKEDECIVLLNY